jgi:cytochrome c551/c552
MNVRRLAVAAIMAGMGAAWAASPSENGRDLAIQGCSACHQVTSDQKRPRPVFDPDQAMSVVPPSFMEIAGKYRGRANGLRHFIRDPKHPMPEQEWDARDLRAVVGYIQSLDARP